MNVHPMPSEYKYVKDSIERTTRWVRALFKRTCAHRGPSTFLVLFKVANIKDLREQSAKELVALDFPDMLLWVVSEPKPVYEMVEHTVQYMPDDKPRYLMGVGSPDALIECSIRGMDMFDCVLPTRIARNGT